MVLRRDLRAILFDFDGTLFDLTVDWDAVRRDLGIAGTGETIGAAIQRLIGDPSAEIVTRHELEAVGDKRIGPSTVDVLKRLSDTYALAVVTRNSRLAVARALEGTQLEAHVRIVGREDVTRLKPDPEAVLLALRELGVEPVRAALVGDTYHDVQAARAAGLFCVVVHNPRLAYPPEGADAYIKRLEELWDENA